MPHDDRGKLSDQLIPSEYEAEVEDAGEGISETRICHALVLAKIFPSNQFRGTRAKRQNNFWATTGV